MKQTCKKLADEIYKKKEFQYSEERIPNEPVWKTSVKSKPIKYCEDCAKG